MTDEQAGAKAWEMFPTAHFIVVGPESVRPFVKAEIDIETAALLAAQDKLLVGTARLCWIPDYAQGDVQRTILGNQSMSPPAAWDHRNKRPSLDEMLERLHREMRSPFSEFMKNL